MQSLNGPLFHPAWNMGTSMSFEIFHSDPHFLYLDETVEWITEVVQDMLLERT